MEYSFVEITGPVQFFPYRTARVANIVATYQGPCVQETEAQLAQAAGARPDNHTVYGLTVEDKPYYLFFTDGKAYGGLALIEGRW
jgi:hypothetical protein